MRRPLAAAALLAVGLTAMVNPLYLPVGEPEVVYVHTVQEAQGDAVAEEAEVVAYGELSAAGRAAFDRALESDSPVEFADADERVDAFDYPAEPEPGNGLLIVERDGTDYELWTSRAEKEGLALLAQRILLQPLLFLAGFFAVLAGLVLAGSSAGWWDGPEA